MVQLTIVQAVKFALEQEMERDSDVLVLGEDVGINGGVFRATEGLFEKFGDNRVVDTPLSETGIVGAAIGLALYGLRPVAEIQFDGFLYSAFDQLISHAGRIRNRSRGRFHVPLVIRVPYGGGIRAPEHHSDSPESYLVHTPGIKVVTPSTPYDTKGLLISAIRDPDPVIFLEPKRIYRAIREDVPEEDYVVPLGEAKTIRAGNDVTLISWGAMVRQAMAAAEKLKGKIDVEVIDLRSLSPIDVETVTKSVAKTGRVVTVHEAPRTCGLGAEITALINERVFLSLKAPVERVTGFDVPFPLYKLEDYYLPSINRIIKGIEKVASF
ncbi:2-oxoisovalerate dehydrogenase [Candidatus Bathyarchaeota archaeon RBG_16_48_13]|nr:MAG: 2-oxoisovalerate dehydrogenase [Candidatus Bathyarchaeota archaeon RBG_16_48_13]